MQRKFLYIGTLLIIIRIEAEGSPPLTTKKHFSFSNSQSKSQSYNKSKQQPAAFDVIDSHLNKLSPKDVISGAFCTPNKTGGSLLKPQQVDSQIENWNYSEPTSGSNPSSDWTDVYSPNPQSALPSISQLISTSVENQATSILNKGAKANGDFYLVNQDWRHLAALRKFFEIDPLTQEWKFEDIKKPQDTSLLSDVIITLPSNYPRLRLTTYTQEIPSEDVNKNLQITKKNITIVAYESTAGQFTRLCPTGGPVAGILDQPDSYFSWDLRSRTFSGSFTGFQQKTFTYNGILKKNYSLAESPLENGGGNSSLLASKASKRDMSSLKEEKQKIINGELDQHLQKAIPYAPLNENQVEGKRTIASIQNKMNELGFQATLLEVGNQSGGNIVVQVEGRDLTAGLNEAGDLVFYRYERDELNPEGARQWVPHEPKSKEQERKEKEIFYSLQDQKLSKQ